MTNQDVLLTIKEYLAAKDKQKELRETLLRFCVEHIGVPQEVAKAINVIDYLDGWLKGQHEWYEQVGK